MKNLVVFALIIFTSAFAAAAQLPETKPSPDEKSASTSAARQYKKIQVSNTSNSKQNGSQTNSTYVRPDAKTRSKRYINSVVGPLALARQAAGAGLSTWRNSPEEWGDRWEGFGRRFASNFGKNVIRQTTTYSLDEAFKLDSQYYRSKNKSALARVTNALISPVTARDAGGKRVFGFPRIIGTYTGNIVAREIWYPARFDWKDGVKSGTISLGFNAAFNLFKEFIWKK